MGISEPRLTQLSKDIRSAERTIFNLQGGIERRRAEMVAIALKPFNLNGTEIVFSVTPGSFFVDVYVNGGQLGVGGRIGRDRIDRREDAANLARAVARHCGGIDEINIQDLAARILNATGTPS